jgi:hypothetical protein
MVERRKHLIFIFRCLKIPGATQLPAILPACNLTKQGRSCLLISNSKVNGSRLWIVRANRALALMKQFHLWCIV